MDQRTCCVDGCARPAFKLQPDCNLHYQRRRRNGHYGLVLAKGVPAEDRFWAKVRKTETCWLWEGAKTSKGYGMFQAHALVAAPAHVYSYLLHHGALPHGLLVMHACDVRSCVNPHHLSAGTQSQNMTDCVARGRHGNQWRRNAS